MRFYILNKNNYMFSGLKLMLNDYLESECIQLDPKNVKNTELYKSSLTLDIFFFISDGEYLDLMSLIHLHHSHSSVIITNNDISWGVSAVFNITIIPQKFTVSDILHGLYFLNIKKKLIQFPRMTKTEKKILILIKKGYATPGICRLMNIKTKTALSHQLNTLKKVGIKTHTPYLQASERLYPLCLWPLR